MNNNDVFRRTRYLFDFSDDEMIKLFKSVEREVSRSQISDWLKKEEDAAFNELKDIDLANFLNALIIKTRGKKEDAIPKPETSLNNNMILRKMKIALNLKSEEIIELFEVAGKKVSKHELSAFFRKPDHKSYRYCNDQYLRNFFNGLQHKHHNKLGVYVKEKMKKN